MGVGGFVVFIDVVFLKSLIVIVDVVVVIFEVSDFGVNFYVKGENGKLFKFEIVINFVVVNKCFIVFVG